MAYPLTPALSPRERECGRARQLAFPLPEGEGQGEGFDQMKLASLKSGRDGRLVIVSRDLMRAVLASSIAPTMQAALDDWPGIGSRSRRTSGEA